MRRRGRRRVLYLSEQPDPKTSAGDGTSSGTGPSHSRTASPGRAQARAPARAGRSVSQSARQARAAIADARRLAARGNFGDAETALQNADKVVPGFAETAMARREIADMRTARGQTGRPDNRQDNRQDNRLAALLATAQAAIARHDYAAADRALDEAERIDARDPAVVQTRNELLEAAARGGRPSNRN